jgi:hypothetical protein
MRGIEVMKTGRQEFILRAQKARQARTVEEPVDEGHVDAEHLYNWLVVKHDEWPSESDLNDSFPAANQLC